MKHFICPRCLRFGVAAFLAVCGVLLTSLPATAATLLSSGVNLGHAGPDLHNWATFRLGAGSPDANLIGNGALEQPSRFKAARLRHSS